MHDWEIIAARDPYFGVLTDEQCRKDRFDADKRRLFYASGEDVVAEVLDWFDADLGGRPSAGEALDIGCGVGRLTHAMAGRMDSVVGYDISDTMTTLAAEHAPPNARFSTTLPPGPFAWINSAIVFQHIPPDEALRLLTSCLGRAAPGAFASIQITFWTYGPQDERTLGQRMAVRKQMKESRRGGSIDPLIKMHDHDLSAVMRCFMERGFERVVLRHTAHGRHHGAWILARKA